MSCWLLVGRTEDCKECKVSKTLCSEYNAYQRGMRAAIDELVKQGYTKYGFDTEYLLKQVNKNNG